MTAGDALRASLVAGAAAVATSGLVGGSAGNLSVRDGGTLLITPQGARLERLGEAECVEVDLADGTVLTPGGRPSSETGLHRAAYAVTDAGAVVHTHSHFATVLGTLVEEVPAVHYATTAFGGTVRVAPYATFGSPELAAGVAEALEGRTGALMANHGAVVCGRDVPHAVELARQLEWLASVAYHALVAGSPRLLGDAELAAVADQGRRLRYETTGHAA
jgi:L-fuculose-phosphate aldolase